MIWPIPPCNTCQGKIVPEDVGHCDYLTGKWEHDRCKPQKTESECGWRWHKHSDICLPACRLVSEAI